jgi:PAS domain S-box-containing protein
MTLRVKLPISLVVLTAAMLMVVAVMVSAGIAGILVADTIRSYASGGTHYATSHLSAVAALRRFARSGLAVDYRQYADRISVADNDRLARMALEDPRQPIENSHAHLIGGRNHPDDVPYIARFFRLFHETDLFRPAIAIWRAADDEIQTLDVLAGQLRDLYAEAPVDRAEADRLLAEVRAADGRLQVFEERFADTLGHAARTVRHSMVVGLVGLGCALALMMCVLTVNVARRQRQADSAIKQREQRFRDVADVAADWIWETDADHRFTYLSQRVEAVAGVPRSAFLGRARAEIARHDDPGWRGHLEDLAARRPFRNFEYKFEDAHGQARHFRVSGKPILAENGEFLGYRGTGTDVTEEMRAQREASQKQRLLEATFEHMAQGISVIDGDLKVIAFNRRFLDLLRVPDNGLAVGDRFERLNASEDLRRRSGAPGMDDIIAETVNMARTLEPYDFARVRADGTVVEIQGRMLPGGGQVTTYTDVTERHNDAARLRGAMAAAEEANSSKSMFLANMSHELRTPLNGIIGFAEIMALQYFGPLNARYLNYAADIKTSADHLLKIINDILDLTKIEIGQV